MKRLSLARDSRAGRLGIPALAVIGSVLGCSAEHAVDAAVAVQGLRDCTATNTLVVSDSRELVKGFEHAWQYQPLDLDQLNQIMAATRAVANEDLTAAAAAAERAGYELRPVRVGDACHLLLEPGSEAPKGQGRLIYSWTFGRDLLIEAPHVPEDHETDVEAAILFDQLRARALVIAGAHRCAVADSSGCRSSNQCNKLGVPVESDPSHSVHNAVNAMHLAFRETDVTTIQLHTNFRPDANGDARISNGTRSAIAGTAADAFFHALQAPDVDARTCNDPDAPPDSAAFCGESNTQGLASNGAADPCLGHPSSKGGPDQHRFIHLEQNNDRMNAVDEWSQRIAAALAVAIPETGR